MSEHAPSAEFVRAMGPVAIELLGEPNKALSSKEELRWGNHGSFSVRLDKGTFFDNEAGEGGGVLDLVQQRAHLDKPGALTWLRERGHLAPLDGQGRPSRKILTTYPYHDERRALLFEVVRFDPKDFRQRKPDGIGGWDWKLGDTRRVLFRLPEIIEAVQAGRTIYVAEGEKAALAVVGLNLDATCSPGGAGKWRPEYNSTLSGADVVVLSDFDAQSVDRDGKPRWHPDGSPVLPGQDHAADVARHLEGVARQVRVLLLPGLPLGGDVADWIEAGGTWDRLEALADEVAPAPSHPQEPNHIAARLSAEAWVEREFAPPVRLLGDLVTTTTRAFLVGSTGLGKTMFGMALAAGMASGQGFLNWRCDRPVRVLYLDGEMPAELVRSRVRDATRRLGAASVQGNLFLFSADDAEAFSKDNPSLGSFQPLNTEAGQNFLYALINALGGVDCIILDNVMSLVAGDQKDEVPWSQTLSLVAGLTRRQVGQIWLDHVGHNSTRQYGSSTKAWRFDAVGVMTELPEGERVERETAFKLSFDAPGKARRRSPENWREFAPRTIRLADDVWSSDGDDGSASRSATVQRGKVSPSRAIFHSALVDALVSHSTSIGTTTMGAWEAECIRRGLLDPAAPDEDGKARTARLNVFRSARSHLAAAGWVGIDGERVSDLVGNYGLV